MKKFDKFVNENKNDIIEEIKYLESVKDIRDYIFKCSCGFHFPFNPPDPLRSLLREKMEEFKDEEDFETIKGWYSKVTGEYVPTPPLPPGAVY